LISLCRFIGDNGLEFDSGIEIISCALTPPGCISPSPAMQGGSTGAVKF